MKKTYLSLLALLLALQLSAQTNDVGIIKIIEPDTFMCANQHHEVKVRIKNFGTLTQTTFPVNYQRGIQTPVTETFNGSLLAGDSVDFTFQTKVTCPIGTSVSLTSWTKLSNDIFTQNDTICKNILIITYFGPYIIEYPSNHIINAYTNTTNYYHAYYSTYYDSNINVHWYYQPSNDVLIVTNGVGDSATIQFGNNASTGILSVYFTGAHCNSDTLTYTVNLSALGINDIDNTSFTLKQNTPNPASAITSIKYSIPTTGIIKFEVLNILGQSVYSKTEKQQAGENSISLNVKDFKNGIYYYSIEFKGKKLYKKMVVAR